MMPRPDQYRHDSIALVALPIGIFFVLGQKEAHQSLGTFVCADAVEEMSDFFLKEYYDGNGSYADQLVEDATQKFHFQYLADNNPETDKDEHAVENVYGT